MTAKIEIMRARLDHAEEMEYIAAENRLGFTDTDKGFLFYTLSKDDYEERIKKSKHTYVCKQIDPAVPNPIGFLMCYDNRELDELLASDSFNHESEIISKISQASRPFIFGDQIGVLYHQEGIGTALLNRLFTDMTAEHINRLYVAVMAQPKMNWASTRFVTKLGFEPYAHVDSGLDGTSWTIYEKKLER